MKKNGMKKRAGFFLCVLAFVMFALPFATLPVQAAQNLNVGYCYQVDPASKPIVVDGKMDEAYRYGFCATIDCYAVEKDGVYTCGVAYFAWSGNSIYCYVIVNDVDIAQPAAYWQADCVELYLHRGDDASRDYPDTSNAYLNSSDMPIVPEGQSHAGSQRGRQYRIDGSLGTPTCHLFGEGLTYEWNENKGRLYNENGAMITDTLNAFGWYKGGWANHIFQTGSSGYAVEYKIDFETPLQPGEKFRFDLMVSDRHGNPYSREQLNIYYNSAIRQEKGPTVSNINQYDHFTLSSVVAYNNSIIADEALYTYGRNDTSEPKTEEGCLNHSKGVRAWITEDSGRHVGYCKTCNAKVYATHSPKALVTKQATCKTTGTRKYYCNDCSVLLYTEIIPKLSTHTWNEGEITLPSSCSADGTKTYTCQICQTTKTEPISMLGHDEIAHEAQAPTCTEIGWDDYVECSACEYTTYVEQSALGHDEIAHGAQASTCTAIGWDAYVTCSRCDYTTYEEKPMSEHAWDGGTVTLQQTCTTPWIVTYCCENCTKKKTTTLNNGELLPHTYDREIAEEKYLKSPATETEDAIYYKSCACGAKGEETFVLKAESSDASTGCGGAISGTWTVCLALGVAALVKSRKRKAK